jgi:hypothetical protein
MNSEINDQTCYSTENFYNPDWWDRWLKKNLKKKTTLFSKTVKQAVTRRQTILGFNNLLLVILTAIRLK